MIKAGRPTNCGEPIGREVGQGALSAAQGGVARRVTKKTGQAAEPARSVVTTLSGPFGECDRRRPATIVGLLAHWHKAALWPPRGSCRVGNPIGTYRQPSDSAGFSGEIAPRRISFFPKISKHPRCRPAKAVIGPPAFIVRS